MSILLYNFPSSVFNNTSFLYTFFIFNNNSCELHSAHVYRSHAFLVRKFPKPSISELTKWRWALLLVSTLGFSRWDQRAKRDRRLVGGTWDLGTTLTTVSPEARNQRVWLNSPSPQVRWHDTFWASSEAICHTVLLRQMKFLWVETSFMISKGNLIVWKQRVGLVSTLGYALAASSTLKEREESLTMTAADEFPQGSHYLLGHVAVLF